MDEFGLIRQYFSQSGASEDVLLGIGDDCAVLRLPVGRNLVVSMDTMVQGVHFPVETPPRHIGSRVLCAALSDLAAMGAQPHWFTLGLTLPDAEPQWLSEFSEGLFWIAEQYECSLVGGDTTRGPLCISVQVHGSASPDGILQRSGANPGDVIYVTGQLGDGAAALALLSRELTVAPSCRDYLLTRFYSPAPRLQDGQLLVGLASSAIDISDGFYQDLRHICDASGVGARLDLGRLPMSEHWTRYANEDQCLEWALTGGDDYELCFTVPRQRTAEVEKHIRSGRITATAVGKIVERQDIVLVREGHPYSLKNRGFNHFGH